MSEFVKQQYRFPKDLDDWLKKKAEKADRTKNGELTQLIRKAKEREAGRQEARI